MAGSLFERLTQGEAGVRMDDDESIRRHLIRMLTTRQGAVQALPEYGLPDLNDLTLSRSELVIESCKAIEVCIAAYEPRLADVSVTKVELEDAPFTMGFRISAMKIDATGKRTPWHWSVTVDGANVREKV